MAWLPYSDWPQWSELPSMAMAISKLWLFFQANLFIRRNLKSPYDFLQNAGGYLYYYSFLKRLILNLFRGKGLCIFFIDYLFLLVLPGRLSASTVLWDIYNFKRRMLSWHVFLLERWYMKVKGRPSNPNVSHTPRKQVSGDRHSPRKSKQTLCYLQMRISLQYWEYPSPNCKFGKLAPRLLTPFTSTLWTLSQVSANASSSSPPLHFLLLSQKLSASFLPVEYVCS